MNIQNLFVFSLSWSVVIFLFFFMCYLFFQHIKTTQYINKIIGLKSQHQILLTIFKRNIFNYYKKITPFKYNLIIQKIILGHIMGGILIFLLGFLISQQIDFAFSLCFFYFIIYIIFFKSQKNKETRSINQKLPDFLELFCLFLKAGISMPQAIEKLLSFFEQSSSEFSHFLKEILNEVKKGENFVNAFELSTQKFPQTKLKTLSLYFKQAEIFGTPLTYIFQTLAKDMRNDTIISIEEKAQKLGILLSLPLICCFLPALLLLIFGPALLQLIETLQKIL